MSNTYGISPAAKHDLKRIFKYTYQTWGSRQGDTYVAALHKCMENMAATPAAFRLLAPEFENIRIMHCQEHVLIAQQQSTTKIRIIGIFHKSMNIIDRVTHRLQ